MSKHDLESLLDNDWVQDYNPIEDYFKSLKPIQSCGPNIGIANLSNYIKVKDQEIFIEHLRKWMVRSIRCALDPEAINKNAIVLVSASQNTGIIHALLLHIKFSDFNF